MVSIIGSTGSIGRQTLQVLDHLGLRPVALAAEHSVNELESQCRQYNPKLAVLADENAARDLRKRLDDTSTKVMGGEEAVCEAAIHPDAKTTVIAAPGLAGLKPTIAAIGTVPRIALANKESMVCAGQLIMNKLWGSSSTMLPVDSELSAIHKCLEGIPRELVQKITITASGGPFYGRSLDSMHDVTIEEALRHPTWKMGKKITIDSATLLNKGYEIIETMNYFGVPLDLISVSIHRQSIIHAIVEYTHKSPYMYMSVPDMRLAIQYALTYPEIRPAIAKPLDLYSLPPLTQEHPDLEAFPCLALAIEAAKMGGYAGTALTAAGEVAVDRFLNGSLRFTGIAEYIEDALKHVPEGEPASIDDVLGVDAEIRNYVRSFQPQPNIRTAKNLPVQQLY